MKRNLLFLALFVAAFCFAGTAMAQDAGDPDTLALETYGALGVVGPPGPWFFTTPLFVTNDIVDNAVDSIAGFVIPLCYYATDYGVVNYCSLSA